MWWPPKISRDLRKLKVERLRHQDTISNAPIDNHTHPTSWDIQQVSARVRAMHSLGTQVSPSLLLCSTLEAIELSQRSKTDLDSQALWKFPCNNANLLGSSGRRVWSSCLRTCANTSQLVREHSREAAANTPKGRRHRWYQGKRCRPEGVSPSLSIPQLDVESLEAYWRQLIGDGANIF